MINKQEPINIDVIKYRLDEMERNFEKNIEKISEKIDAMIEKSNESLIQHRELKVKVENLEIDLEKVKTNNESLKEDLNNVKISMAEKMGYGLAGGGIVTFLTKLFEETTK